MMLVCAALFAVIAGGQEGDPLTLLGEVRVRLQSHFSIKAEHGVTRVAQEEGGFQRLVGSLDEGELHIFPHKLARQDSVGQLQPTGVFVPQVATP